MIKDKNAATSAKVDGVKDTETGKDSHEDVSPETTSSAMPKFPHDRHKRAGRMLEYVLTLGSTNTWVATTDYWRKRLTLAERVALAYSVLAALPPDLALETAQLSMAGDGQPQAPLFGFMDEATFWADMAVPEELEAYCLACFNRMESDRQVAFLRYVHSKVLA